MRRIRPRPSGRAAEQAALHAGLHAVRRRAARAAAALVLVVLAGTAAAASAATNATRSGRIGAPTARAPSPAAPPSVAAILTTAPSKAESKTQSPGSGGPNAVLATVAPAPAPAAAQQPGAATQPSSGGGSLTAPAAGSDDEAAAAADDAPLAKVAPKILPGGSLLGRPDPQAFEAYPGCRPHVYGVPGLPNFVVYCESGNATTPGSGRNVSYWHEIPLDMATDPRDGTVSIWVTVEIPKGTNAKIETQTAIPYTPMAQSNIAPIVATSVANLTARSARDLRYYGAGPSLVNYGGIPQTWEASDRPDEVTGAPSDNDPLDFVEIGGTPAPVGTVVRVQLLGALPLVDGGETDWKMVVLSTKDVNATAWRNISDVPPEIRRRLYEFFRTYKVAEGKALNTFFVAGTNTTTSRAEDWDAVYVGREAAVAVLRHKNQDWRRLQAGGCSSPKCAPLMSAAAAGGIVVVGAAAGAGGIRDSSDSLRNVSAVKKA